MNTKNGSYNIIDRSLKGASHYIVFLHSRRGSNARAAFIGMKNDLEMIVKTYPEDMNVLRVYAIGDIHVGAPEFDEQAIKKKIKIIQDDPNGVVSLCGDLGNFGLASSVTNCYLEKLSPAEQQEYICRLLEPIKEKIIACVPGNHEERLVRETSINPLYTICCKLGIEDVFRDALAITKLSFGYITGRQMCFVIITTHGATRAKHRRFTSAIDNIDAGISGHSHTPEYSPRGRLRVNSKASTVSWVPYKELVVDAHLKPGGYSLKKEYEIAPPPELQYLELSIYRDNTRQRRRHKVINYHAIQL